MSRSIKHLAAKNYEDGSKLWITRDGGVFINELGLVHSFKDNYDGKDQLVKLGWSFVKRHDIDGIMLLEKA